jgi:hypothetical protein
MFFLFTGGAGRKACDSLPGLFLTKIKTFRT